jgi:triacylglycerol lipase
VTDSQADARLALCVLDAEDMYAANGPAVLQPALGPRIAADWNLCGYIIGTDALFRPLGALAPGSQRVFYGLLAESKSAPDTFVAVVRGTDGIVEWLEDAEFFSVPNKRPGMVEAGFFGIYDSFAFLHAAGSELPLVSCISAIVGNGKLTVTGHSLGAALATYLALDLAKMLPDQVSLRIFASPHPGDITFTDAVAAAVPDHVHYRNVADLVPRVPLGLGYAHLPNTVDLSPTHDALHIRMNLGCLHHAICYAALLDPSVLQESIPAQDRSCRACITLRAAA